MQNETSNSSLMDSTAAARNKTAAVELREYLDYRTYLSDWFQARKGIQSSYSGAMFAKKAGLKSHTLLGMVIRGDRNLTTSTIRSFAKALDLTPRDTLYFEKLALFNQAKKAEDRSYYLSQLKETIAQGKDTPITRLSNYSRYVSHWYMVAIREMIALSDFQEDPQWIAAALKNRISSKQAKEALELLFELKLIGRNETGSLRVIDLALNVDNDTRLDFAIRSYHREFLKISEHALDHEGIDERHFNSVTLSLTEDQIKAAQEEIENFTFSLNQKYALKSKGASSVVAFNTQLLQLTTRERKKI